MEVKVKVFENSNVNIDNFSKYKPVLSNISKNIEKEINSFMSNSFGFGGTNGSIIIKKI